MSKQETQTADEAETIPVEVRDGGDNAGTQDGDDPIATLQADMDRFRDLALRSQADFDNYKKRASREKEDAIKYANSSLLERLITMKTAAYARR